MKKFIAAVLLCTVLVGCGRDVPTPEEEYIDNLQRYSDTFDNADEELLIKAGKDICNYFDEFGASDDDMFILGQQLSRSFSERDSAVVIAVAIDSFCPEYKVGARRA